jgi:hypothetical protein
MNPFSICCKRRNESGWAAFSGNMTRKLSRTGLRPGAAGSLVPNKPKSADTSTPV